MPEPLPPVLRGLLEDRGHAVEVASSVEEGLGACRHFGPDLLLLDVRLPGRDGLFVGRRPGRDLISRGLFSTCGGVQLRLHALSRAFGTLERPAQLRLEHHDQREEAHHSARLQQLG